MEKLLKNQKILRPKDELVSFKNRWRAVTIPVNIKIDFQQSALHLDHVKDIIHSAKKHAVMNCFCRMNLQNCNFQLEVCLSLDVYATKLVKDGKAKFISVAEAEKIVLETHEKGLVHFALHRPGEPEQNIQIICSCCSCCCHAFQGLLLMNMKGLVKPSKYISTHDQEKCIGCGECSSLCHFEARTLDQGGILAYNVLKCFGCGLCITQCPQDAIKMIRRH